MTAARPGRSQHDDARALAGHAGFTAGRFEADQRQLPVAPGHLPQVPGRCVAGRFAALEVDQFSDGDIGQHQVAVGQGQEQAGELAGAGGQAWTCSDRRCFPAAPTPDTACRGSR